MTAEDALNSSSMVNDYDSKAEEYNWRGPEVAFGLSYSFVNPGESVLDIGIGTGLGSILFHKAGLHVYGMDVSTEMLEASRGKRFATDLKEHDLTVEPYPYDAGSLDHAVCLGRAQFLQRSATRFQRGRTYSARRRGLCFCSSRSRPWRRGLVRGGTRAYTIRFNRNDVSSWYGRNQWSPERQRFHVGQVSRIPRAYGPRKDQGAPCQGLCRE